MERERQADTPLLDEVRERMRLLDPPEGAAIRRRAGVSQDRIAAELGIHRVTVARWESGSRRPRGELFRRYADLLNGLERELAAQPSRRQTTLGFLRQREGWPLAMLSSLTSITENRVWAIEHRLATPSPVELRRLCESFNWPLDRADELLNEADQPGEAAT